MKKIAIGKLIRIAVLATAGCLTCLGTGTVAVAGESGPGHYASRPAGRKMIAELARTDGIPAATTRKLLASAQYQPGIIAKMRKPAEKTLTWAGYRPIFVTPERARQGAAYIQAHRALFSAAEKKYGVPDYMIAAILGVETRYGRFVGRDRVLDALSTLAFDYPERSAFFSRELASFIKLCVGEQLDCQTDVGSYAGAMGLPQFMPSSYAAYAVDGNGDGRRDLWTEPADVIDSVANYLARNGWQRGADIAYPAQLADAGDIAHIQASTRKTAYNWDALRRKGVETTGSLAADTPVGLLAFDGPHGPEYWIGLKNFFVITTYNTSPLYAMAVYQLGREIHAYTRPDPDA